MTDDAAVPPPDIAGDLRSLATKLDELRRSPVYGYYSLVPTSTIQDLADRALTLAQVTQGSQ